VPEDRLLWSSHVIDRIEVQRLVLKIERASLVQSNLKLLLGSANAALTTLRGELRAVRGRGRRVISGPLGPGRVK